MTTGSVYFTDVNLPQPVAMLFEYPRCFQHSRVNLPNVTNVKAHPGFWERFEEHCQIGSSPAACLAFVHVLDEQQ